MSKEIRRIGKEFDVYVDGEYVGTRGSYSEAQKLADETAYRALGGK